MDGFGRLEELFTNSVKKICDGADEVAVVFSSGVDSSIVAYAASRYSTVTAYNVGVEGSNDAEYARKYEHEAPFKIKYVTLSQSDVEELIPAVIAASKSTNPLDVGVGIPFYCASRVASEDGFKKILCGQGGDELFGGYWRYLELLVKEGDKAVISRMERDWASAYEDNLNRDMAMCAANNVQLLFPFLDGDFSQYVRDMQFDAKIRENADVPCDEIEGRRFARKYALKKMALHIGLPDYIVNRPKKAAQYGSGTQKTLDKIARKNGFKEKAHCTGRTDYTKLYLDYLGSTVLKKE